MFEVDRIIKRIAILTFFFIAAFNFVSAQGNFTLKGKVVDDMGETLIGAHVKVMNQPGAASTNVDGDFSVAIQGAEAEIQISYIGYALKLVKVKQGDSPIVVVLNDNHKELDEIVIVGYGAQRKTALTSSVEVIKSDDLLKMPTANLDQALNGQAAGLQVMSSTGDPSSRREADIRIRGNRGNPLLVIDGIPRYGVNEGDAEMRLSDINPDDVESISILKDGAGAAVYGMRAANGVILVTTKRGVSDKKVRVNYRGQYNLQAATMFPEFVNSYEFAQLFNRAVDNTPGTLQKKYTLEELEKIRTQSSPNEFSDINMIDYLNKTASSTTHSLSMQGGGEQVGYYISGGYTNTQGLYSGLRRDRYNYSIKLDATLLKDLVFSIDVIGSRSANKNTGYATVDGIYSVSPLQVLRYSSGQMASINGGNPLIGIEGLGGYVDAQANFSTLSGNLKYKLPRIDGLSVYAKATNDFNVNIDKTFSNPVTLYLYDKATQQISEDPLTTYPKAKIALKQRDLVVKNMLLETGINYNRTFASKHDVAAMLIAIYQNKNTRLMDGTNKDLPGVYPETMGTALDAALNGTEFFDQMASVVGRATYGYSSRYFVEANFRLDGSPRFAPKNRWGIFPSVSGSWVLSNEDFFKNWKQPILSNVKIRASAGLLGDDAGISYYSYLLNYRYFISSGYPIGGNFKPGVVIDTGTYPNPNLKWGKSQDYNMGIDLGFWNNRLEISMEYYQRYLTNMVRQTNPFNFPPSTGNNNSLPFENFGKVKAWGWDLSVRYRNTIGKKFKYDATLALTKTDDLVLDYGDESSLDPLRRRAGKSSMMWWLYQADGLFKSDEEIANHPLDQDQKGNSTLAPGDIRYVDVKKDGLLTEDDRVPVKNSSYPDLSYSIKLGAGYGGFFFNAMFQGVSGYNQLIPDLYTLNTSSLQRFQTYHVNDTWTPENPNAAYPRIKFATTSDNNRKSSTFWLKNSDFVRLKNMSIGYAFQAKTLQKLKISSLSVALQGSNLFTWSNLENNIDPESLRGYPIQRSYGVTVNFGF